MDDEELLQPQPTTARARAAPGPERADARAPLIEKSLDLLKPPIWVFSILAALVVAHHALGLQIGQVSKVTATGVEFQSDAGKEIADLTSRLDGAVAAIAEMRKTGSDASPASEAAVQSAIDTAGLYVPDRVAKLATVAATATPETPVRGWIWLGNYDGTKWTRANVAWPDTGAQVDASPASLEPGKVLTLTANLYIRDGQPSNDSAYFNSRKTVGVAARDSRIRIVATPVAYDRTSARQYWAQVDIL